MRFDRLQEDHTGQPVPGTFSLSQAHHLYKEEPADFETNPFYTITIETIDSGEPPLSNQNTFNISIGDINEPPLGFNVSSFRIPEYTQSNISDTRAGTVIGLLTVLDGDHPWLENHTLTIVNADWQSAKCFDIQTRVEGQHRGNYFLYAAFQELFTFYNLRESNVDTHLSVKNKNEN